MKKGKTLQKGEKRENMRTMREPLRQSEKNQVKYKCEKVRRGVCSMWDALQGRAGGREEEQGGEAKRALIPEMKQGRISYAKVMMWWRQEYRQNEHG